MRHARSAYNISSPFQRLPPRCPSRHLLHHHLSLRFGCHKTMLRSQYASQTPKQNPGTNQQLEIEVTAEKARRVLTSDGGVSEGVASEDKGPSFADLGGMEEVIEKLLMEVVVPLCCPELPRNLGVRPIAGLLLHGPPGCGKTTLAHAIANETGVPFYKISAPEIVSGVSGGSEENIRGLFQKAYGTAPSIVFIDEIDAIASKRENLQREMERRIVTQLMTCMDEFHQNSGGDDSDANSSENNPGYALVNNAGYLAMKRLVNERRVRYRCEHEEETKLVQPSLRREGFSSIPDVTWDDVGGLDSLRKEFERYIVRCIKSPEDCDEYGVSMQDGFLLFGPPGCGKTLIAKAVAHEAGANFIHIKLLNKYVGESESEVRKIFSRARTNSPCIIFFDEVDALATKRGKEGGWVVERLLNQVNDAAMVALEERWEFHKNRTSSMSSSPRSIELTHFEQALSKVKPSVSEQD
ncbi:hypothetical protein EJB05_23302, partial [Eragrostis curvula]